ncbi:MAG: GNAT family N-acetyltransferase [Alphaproteobacteria bacterium]|nr:GNAT family N-acetyltransferase [Alphaproteobacteria bacterium]
MLGDVVHPAYPERTEIFAEKFMLYPKGCFVLAPEGIIVGYVQSYPARSAQPQELDSSLGQLPADADTYYIHDIAIAPSWRRRGKAIEFLNWLEVFASCQGFHTLSLTAVNRSRSFWERRGFSVLETDMLRERLHSYGEDAFYMVKELSFS